MKLKHLKLDFFYLRKAFFEYHRGLRYLHNRYSFAPSILARREPIERGKARVDVTTHVLTGKRDFVMLLWALTSLYRTMEEPGTLYIHSDGTLGSEEAAVIARLFPHAVLLAPHEFETRYGARVREYPEIARWRFGRPNFFLLKKLIDPYFASHAPLRLIIDSDVLWFHPPTHIMEALARGAPQSLMMTNASPAYVYFKDGTPLDDVAASYNSGIVCYHTSNFNLPRLEAYLSRTDEMNYANVHFIEQAGYASCLDHLAGLPLPQYHIKGEVTEETMVKHYTSPRRPLFYSEGIPRIASTVL